MFNLPYNFSFDIYSLLFHPKYFFEGKKKKANDLMATLPFFLFGIGIASFTVPFNSITNSMNSSFPSVLSLISSYIFSLCFHPTVFLIQTIIVYHFIRLLGEELSYRNFLSTMLFLPIFLIGELLFYLVLFLFESIATIPAISCFYGLIVAITILYIWKSYCAIIGLSTMQQINRKVATVGILLPFSFFYALRILVILVGIASRS